MSVALRNTEELMRSHFEAQPIRDWRDESEHYAANLWAYRHSAGIESIDSWIALIRQWGQYDDQMRRIEAIARDMIEAAKGAA